MNHWSKTFECLLLYVVDFCVAKKLDDRFEFIPARRMNVSSVAGLYGYPGLSTYCATKHAIEAVRSVLRHELVKFDISVVTVQPGDFSKATHLLDNHPRNMNEMWSEMSDGQREEYKEYFIAYHNGVAKTGITGKRIKPLTVLPKNGLLKNTGRLCLKWFLNLLHFIPGSCLIM